MYTIEDTGGHTPTPEAPKTLETQPFWDQVVFGHWRHDFDRDQFFAWWFAQKLGLISSQAPVEFKPYANPTDESNPKTLVIEGITNTATQVNKAKNNPGNFDNGSLGEPAAFMLWNAYADQPAIKNAFPQEPQQLAQLKELATWFNRREQKITDTTQYTQLSGETIAKLELLVTSIFRGVTEANSQNPENNQTRQPTLLELSTILENALDLDISLSTFSQRYSQHIELGTQRHEEAKQKTREYLQTNPEKVRTANISLIGEEHPFTVCFADTTGLEGKPEGTFSALPQADLVCLIGNELNDAGETVGQKITIQVNPDNQYLKQTILAELPQRLNQTEMLFGRGALEVTLVGFGGHEGKTYSSLHSPRGGSQLETEQLLFEIQRFLQSERFTRVELQASVQAAAEIHPELSRHTVNYPQVTEGYIPELSVTFTTTQEHGLKVTQLTESEWALYSAVVANTDTSFTELLNAKTEFSQHPQVDAYQLHQVRETLTQALQESNGIQALLSLEKITGEQLQNLSGEQALQLWLTLSKDPLCINSVYDPFNPTFSIVQQHSLPDWITTHPELKAEAKYRYQSVPQKIDTVVVKLAMEHAQRNPEIAAKFIASLLDVLTSPAYQETHHTQLYDQLGITLLELITSTKTPSELQVTALNTTQARITPEMIQKNLGYWQQMGMRNPGLLHQTQQLWPELAQFSLIPENLHSIATIPNSYILPLEKHSLDELHNTNNIPTILLEISARDHTRSLSKQGIMVDGAVGVRGFISIENAQQLQTLSKHTVEMAKEALAATSTETKVRLVLGSQPSPLSFQLGLTLAQQLSPEDQKRLVLCVFNQQTQRWNDLEIA